MGVADRTPRPPLPVDPRPAGVDLLCMVDGYPLVPEVSPALQHLLVVRSVKQLQFVPSHQVPVGMGMHGRGGMVVITTKRPKATRRQWQEAMQEAASNTAKR
jgi:hypothetical protein